MANDEGEDWKNPFEEKKELEEEEEEEAEQIIAPPKSNGERACGVCGQIFKSGKALGGHMRVHFLNKNKNDDDKQQQQNKKKKKKKDSEETVEIPICEHCGRTFPSQKSMYGHLRSHPDRCWRGSRPPSNGVVINDDRIKNSMMLMLSNWTITGKRGSNGNKSISDYSRSLIEEDEELRQGAANLWFLSRGGGGGGGRNSTAPTPPSSILRGSSSQAAPADVAAESDHILPMPGSSITSDDDDDEKLTRKLINFKSDSTNSCNKNNKNKRKLVMDSESCQKSMKSITKNPNQKNQNQYQCNICNKRFMSYHGLGGHMSIHSNRERIMNNSKQDIGIGIQLYGCRWCKKRFSTAQDLEDHKCHKSTNGGTLTIFGVPREDDNNVSQDVNLCFDLNEMPSLQEDVHKLQPSSSDDEDEDNNPRVTARASEAQPSSSDDDEEEDNTPRVTPRASVTDSP